MRTQLAIVETEAVDLCASPATELAARIRRGEVTAAAAVEAYITKLEAVNSRLNALVCRRYAEAGAEAREVDRKRAAGEPLGPLAGVPVTVKESLDLAGTASTFGVPSRREGRAAADEKHVVAARPWREDVVLAVMGRSKGRGR